ncbi:hypothetical protein R6Q57_029456 [Mikania cordata]
MLKRKKGKKNKQPAGAGPSSSPMAPKQWTPDEETALGRCFMDESGNKTKVYKFFLLTFWGRIFSGMTIVLGKGFQWGDDVAGNFSGEGISVR